MLWVHLFSSITLAAAKACYEAERVRSLRKNGDDYHATVLEHKNVYVSIKVKDDTVAELHCSCRKAAAGKKCQHMAAVLYAIEQAQMDEWQQEEIDWESLGTNMDEEGEKIDNRSDQNKTYTYFNFAAMKQEISVKRDIWSRAVQLAGKPAESAP